MNKEKVRELFKKSGIPYEYWNFSINTYKKSLSSEVKPTFMKYYNNLSKAKRQGISLLLAGTNGTGKTGLSVEILKKAITEGMTAHMISLTELIELYTAGWRSEEAKVMLDKILNVDFLLIDDLGKEIKLSENQENLVRLYFENLMRKRSGWYRPVLITTNASRGEVIDYFGKNVLSIMEGHFLKLTLAGKDYRKKLGKKLLSTVEGW